MICVVIKGPTFQEAQQQIKKALEYTDLVELRLDCFTSLDLDSLRSLRSQIPIPMIFTLRSQSQGGSYTQAEENRLVDIRRLAELKPEYLDLENHISPEFIGQISSQHPEIKLILSYHNFIETPRDLDKIYQEMRKVSAFFYKIAVTANHCLDALQFVCWAKKFDGKLIAISMGSHGQVSRILGPIMGSPITYASLDEDQKSAPGQLSAKTFVEKYHHKSLNPRTALYGLIGDPVDLSISDETHNHLIKACGFDAVYVKIQVHSSELSEFMQLAKKLPFRGLSVTMPLKEKILSFIDEIDPQALDIGAVNTLLFENGKISGFNTDGIGALNAIEKEHQVKGKRIILIGAGGAAKSIAFEAHQRGALVTILNRNPEKALQLARTLQCAGKGLEEMASCAQAGYDILINCTPSPLPIDPNDILPHSFVMDIKTKSKDIAFLQYAKEKKCRLIYGYQMFIEQALGQFHLWFKNRFNIQESRIHLENQVAACLSPEPTH